jgi:urease beta subunit
MMAAAERRCSISAVRAYEQSGPVELRATEGEVFGHYLRVRVLGAEALLFDGERALVERLGFAVAVGVAVEPGQIVEAGCHVRVRGAEALLGDGERALVERLGLAVAVGVAVEPGQI